MTSIKRRKRQKLLIVFCAFKNSVIITMSWSSGTNPKCYS